MELDKNTAAAHEFSFEICNNRMRIPADRLIQKYDELHHIEVDRILFLINHKSGGSKKKIVLAKTSRIPENFRDILFQLGACSYLYLIEFISKTTASLDENQMVALLYRELRKIGPDGQIVDTDINDWYQMLQGLGRRWYYPDNSCPNLLDDNVDWKKLMGVNYEPPRGWGL